MLLNIFSSLLNNSRTFVGYGVYMYVCCYISLYLVGPAVNLFKQCLMHYPRYLYYVDALVCLYVVKLF